MMRSPTGSTRVAGVAGAPIAHSLSPTLHNAWIVAAGIDAVYVAFAPPVTGFAAFVEGMRGGAVRGINVTAPFKETALAAADRASARARSAGAANLLLFERDGEIVADNTDGEGLLAAFAEQAPAFDVASGPIVILGAGGAARGAATALLGAGAACVRIVNRSRPRGEALVELLGENSAYFPQGEAAAALSGAVALINATPVGVADAGIRDLSLEVAPARLVVMDMVYKPLRTGLLCKAQDAGLTTVDGLAMLIGQAAPSFTQLFGVAPPALDVRAVALAALKERR
jgi:shikimate dehydrogenase